MMNVSPFLVFSKVKIFSSRQYILNTAKNILVLVFLSMCLSHVATAARFPDAVEMKVVLRGENAVTVAKLLGLSVDINSSLQLPFKKVSSNQEKTKGREVRSSFPLR